MDIKWAALAGTFGVSLAITLAVVTVFSAGIVALGKSRDAAAAVWTGTAYLCFAACAAAVGYGLYLIANK